MTSRPLRDITKTPNTIEDIHTVFAQLFFPVIFPHLRLCKPQQCESLLQPMHPIKHLVLLFCTTRQLPESDHYCSIVSITFFATIFGEVETDIFMLCCVDRHFVASMLFFLCSTNIYQARCELLDSFGHRPKLGGGSQSVEDFLSTFNILKIGGAIFNAFDPFTISLVLLPHVIKKRSKRVQYLTAWPAQRFLSSTCQLLC